MIVRLIIAFTRWVWGVKPVFPDVASSEGWYLVMALAAIIDCAVVIAIVFMVVELMSRRNK